MMKTELKVQKIAGVNIFSGSFKELIEFILNYRSNIMLSTLSFPLLGELKNNIDYKKALESSEIILPDGIGIIVLSTLTYGKNRIKNRIAGPDFFMEFNKIANEKKISYFFLGSTKETLKRIEERIKKEYPQIIFKGYYSPPFGEWDKVENEKILNKINEKKPDVLWVAMTAPKQEIWVYKNREKLNAKLVASVGATFDFFAGTKKRAPKLFQKTGFEWLHRTFQEPIRMGKRYLKGFPAFLCFLFKSIGKKSRK